MAVPVSTRVPQSCDLTSRNAISILYNILFTKDFFGRDKTAQTKYVRRRGVEGAWTLLAGDTNDRKSAHSL